jgi:FGGY-family pentulose kinase/HAD superfamily hydrolase (TIGR01509 family)
MLPKGRLRRKVADNSNFDLVIFDCDGVLVDSEMIAITALIGMFDRAGLSISFEEARSRFLGRSVASILKTVARDHGVELGPDALELMRSELYTAFCDELLPISGIAQTLELLNIPFCVASSSQPERIRLSLEVTGLLPKFDGRIYSATMAAEGKPAPDLFLLAAKAMGAKPTRCLVIEDSPAGIAAAKRAGMTVFGFTGGGHAQETSHQAAIESAAPALVFSDMSKLPELIAGHVEPAKTGDRRYVVAVDVGTGSARAGVIDEFGRFAGRAEHAIRMNRHGADHAEHDSEDIWQAICKSVREALAQSSVDPAYVHGVSFDATCSLVVRDKQGQQLTVSLSGKDKWDTIVWLDHRSLSEADECTATGHEVLSYLGGVMSPEMETPKLMWLKRHLPDTWSRIGHVFDLADFLTWRASGSNTRSQCTLTCKWTYLAHETPQWRRDYFEKIGLTDLLDNTLSDLEVAEVGHAVGVLSEEAAAELGLTTACRVGIGLIDAYGGALGVIGSYASSESGIDRHLALIAGTSSCIMALSREARETRGIWGPYLGAALNDYWLNEGGQSATGALLDHVIRLHGAGGAPDAAMHRRITARIMELRTTEGLDLAGRLHVLPDFHGNRSPFADPHALGVISGLSLDTGFDSLCQLYWRTAVSIALGVRHILDALNENGYGIDTLHITGGHTKNPILMELYADATGCTVVEPLTEDATLLGTGMVAAYAAGFYPTLTEACAAMHQGGARREPNPDARKRFDKDYEIFLEMHRQRQKLDQMLEH